MRVKSDLGVSDNSDIHWMPVRSILGCHSVWPAALPRPPGWQATGLASGREAALDAAAAAWSTEPVAPPVPGSTDTVDRRFFEHALDEPSRIAAVQDGTEYTYAELAALVASVQSGLHELGVRPDDTVGVCMGRSVGLLAVLLGILSCGAAYVPMDDKYPAARLGFMAGDVGVTCVIADDGSRAQLSEVQCPVTTFDELAATEPQVGQASLSRPQGLAYVIYTSGSTGLPKGVEVTNANLTCFLDAVSDLVPAAASERVLFSTPLSFDIAGLEIYWPLTTGGTCLVAPSTWLQNTRALVRLINEGGPTLVQATPVGWRLLLDAGASPGAGQVLLCGGETLPHPLARQLADLPATAINVYGPTEATIWATSWTITGAPALIGLAMSHARVYVLDEQLNQVADDAEGQLYLGGPAVARGYRGQVRLTAGRFLPDPWSPAEAGARMYATGDVVRVTDGQVEWLRRDDTQVKFNGNRIELGEIETIALSVDGVRAAIALITQNPAGPALSLYLESGVDEDLVRKLARQELRLHLPAAVVPTDIQVLAALPLTPNGKVDRIALRSGDLSAR